MKPLSPKPIFIFSLFLKPIPTPQIHPQISHFSTSPNPFHSSPPSSSYPSRRHEEESRSVRVSVWWDFENCSLPANANVFRVSQSITAAIRANGIKGPIQITAFGDVSQLSRSNQEALSSTGINLTHIPHGGKNSADRSLLVDLMYWVSQNPPPAHLLLISGDRDFASILHRLRMNNYNILLASPDNAPGVLCSAASIMWQWNALVRGENLTGKHFNQPPDGPYGSWYGHYRLSLEDPFANTEKSSCSRAEEVSESGSELKLRPVPKAVVKQIRHILNSYPKGISITELRSELWKANVSIDKDLYGYKKFSLFLSSMPQILKLECRSDGQYFIRGTAPKVTEPGESTRGIITGPVSDNGDPDFSTSPKINGGGSCVVGLDEKSSLRLSSKVGVKEPLTKLWEPPKQVEEPPTKVPDPPPVVKKVNNAEVTETHLRSVEEQDPIPEVGFFKRIWRKWNGGKESGSEEKSCGKPENCSTFNNNTEMIKETEEKCVESTAKCADPVHPPSFSSSHNEEITNTNIARSCEANDDKSSRDLSFFNQIMSWFRFWRSSQHTNTLREQYSENMNPINVDSGKDEIFSEDSFWNDMVAFIDTPKSAELVSQSRTRKQMAQNLQQQGPCILRSLSESDLLHLVNLLISDKKWVEECPTETVPFKLIWPAGDSSSFSNPPSSNGLRSIFLGTPSESSSQRISEHDGEKRHQNLPHTGEKRHQNPAHTGVSPHDVHKEPSEKSRGEILADCQKLVNRIVKEYPEGFKMGSFRKLFLERYGYSLDIQKLGYYKLATLLQIMPGVKIESSYIVPSVKVSKDYREIADLNAQENNASGGMANSDSGVSDASRKYDDLDSPWEELGPVANTFPNRNETGWSRKVREEKVGQIHHDYETLSDDDFSDSDEETLSSTGSEGQGKSRINEEESSLLQILNSWSRSKEDNDRMVASESVGGMVDCSRNDLKLPSSSGVGISSETIAVNYGKKQRPPKIYSFVSDSNQHGDKKDKLIDGILGSLKKSSDTETESRI